MGIHRFHRPGRLSARKPLALLDALEPRRLFAATPVGSYPFGGTSSASVTDADGTTAKFSLPGGQGVITVADDGWHVVVSKATAASSLSITTTGGDGRVTLAEFSTSKPLGSINAPKANLSGSMNVTNVKSVTLGNLSDLSLASSSPLASLTLASWTDTGSPPDALTLPSVTSLSVKGNFAPAVTISSKKMALNSATIGGTVSGSWSIAGSAGTLKLHAVRSPDLTISGNIITQLTLDDAIADAPVPGTTGGVIHFGGKGSVSAAKGKDKFQVAKNITIYTVPAAAYDYSLLSENTDLGRKLTYRRSGKTQVAQMSTQTQKVNGVDTYTYSSPGLNGETDTYSVSPTAGTRLVRQDADSDAVSLNASFSGSGLSLAPAKVALGATTHGSSTVSLGISDEGVGGTMHGSAASATRFVGHELVTTPTGTYLAAKVLTTLSFNTSGTISDGENSAPSSVAVNTAYTQWFVPGIGAVRVDTARAVTIKVPAASITRTHHTVTKDELTKLPELIITTPQIHV